MNHPITIEGLAGYCPEVAAWQLLSDLTQSLKEVSLGELPTGCFVPDHISIANGRFQLLNDSSNPLLTPFDAPELSVASAQGQSVASASWSLGALTFYLVMGCVVMNGLGGRGQRRSSKLPYLRPALPELSELVLRCLAYEPTERPTLEEIQQIAEKQLDICQKIIKKGPRPKPANEKQQTLVDMSVSLWPEEMIPNE